MLRYYAPCPRGLEQALADELLALGASDVEALSGGLRFAGDRRLGYAANLHSRIASRVAVEVAQAPYRDADDLYRLSHETAWERWHAASDSLRVDLSAHRSPLRSLNFATLRIKDGIVDRCRERFGERPSVDTRAPVRRVLAHVDAARCTLYLDLSGEPLFKRGWRAAHAEAPLKENLAAGLLRLSGWQPGQALLDPFCGSGTIAIEAATVAAGIAPGIGRGFAFERFRDFDRALWAQLADEARAAVRDLCGVIVGSDRSAAALRTAVANAAAAGVSSGGLRFERRDALSIEPPAATGHLLANPPYGERIGVDAGRAGSADVFWREFGAVLKTRFEGWTASLLSADSALPRALRLDASRRTPLWNGALECRLFRFELYAGSRRARPL
ncbi:MAG: class I SAM-dependent RNA methyltransferase [Burkholderiales bacterium]|nr:MAG: class I SAM-dependent RNA methyltransferase [Burkholderiales bacterium]